MADYQLSYTGAQIDTKLGGGHTVTVTSSNESYKLYYADGTTETKSSGTTGTFNNVVCITCGAAVYVTTSGAPYLYTLDALTKDDVDFTVGPYSQAGLYNVIPLVDLTCYIYASGGPTISAE